MVEQEEPVEVWSVNWPALQLLIACRTQWRTVVGRTGLVWLGLDYAAVDVVMRRAGADDAAFAEDRKSVV